MDRKQIIKDYKTKLQPAGIYAVINKTDKIIFIGSSKNLPAVLRRFAFTLSMESFPYQKLIDDYKSRGAENFEIKILDELEIKNETRDDIDKELKLLEEMWVEKLTKEGYLFYNKK